MAQFERHYHLSVEVWGAKDKHLDEEERLRDLLIPDYNQTVKEIIHPFEPFGITGIALDHDGAIMSAHHWPEFNYGIYTYFGNYPKMNPFLKRILDIYEPSGIISVRPDDIKHLTASFDTSSPRASEKISLLKTGREITKEEKLAVFDETAAQTDEMITAIWGLETSHLTIQSKRPYASSPIRRVYLDALTCDKKTNLDGLAQSIYKWFKPWESFVNTVEYSDISQENTKKVVAENKLLINTIRII